MSVNVKGIHSSVCVCFFFNVCLISASEDVLCLTWTYQLMQTSVLFGRGSYAPHPHPRRALEGGWEWFITHSGWGWLLGYCTLSPGSKYRNAVALENRRAALRWLMMAVQSLLHDRVFTFMEAAAFFVFTQSINQSINKLINSTYTRPSHQVTQNMSIRRYKATSYGSCWNLLLNRQKPLEKMVHWTSCTAWFVVVESPNLKSEPSLKSSVFELSLSHQRRILVQV